MLAGLALSVALLTPGALELAAPGVRCPDVPAVRAALAGLGVEPAVRRGSASWWVAGGALRLRVEAGDAPAVVTERTLPAGECRDLAETIALAIERATAPLGAPALSGGEPGAARDVPRAGAEVRRPGWTRPEAAPTADLRGPTATRTATTIAGARALTAARTATATAARTTTATAARTATALATPTPGGGHRSSSRPWRLTVYAGPSLLFGAGLEPGLALGGSAWPGDGALGVAVEAGAALPTRFAVRGAALELQRSQLGLGPALRGRSPGGVELGAAALAVFEYTRGAPTGLEGGAPVQDVRFGGALAPWTRWSWGGLGLRVGLALRVFAGARTYRAIPATELVTLPAVDGQACLGLTYEAELPGETPHP